MSTLWGTLVIVISLFLTRLSLNTLLGALVLQCPYLMLRVLGLFQTLLGRFINDTTSFRSLAIVFSTLTLFSNWRLGYSIALVSKDAVKDNFGFGAKGMYLGSIWHLRSSLKPQAFKKSKSKTTSLNITSKNKVIRCVTLSQVSRSSRLINDWKIRLYRKRK